jgi:hypothetical protein
MKKTILIHTQYQENYGAHDWDGTGICPQQWKNKGGTIFSIEMEADLCMYTDPSEVFQSMLNEDHNNEFVKYTYKGHDIQFSIPTPIGTDSNYIKHYQKLEIDKQLRTAEGHFRMA